MGISFILAMAAAGAFLLLSGLVTGLRINHSQKAGDESESFREAIKRWREVVVKIDELTRRNAVGLGSVRERLTEFQRSLDDLRLVKSIDELTEQVHVLKNEVRGLKEASGFEPGPAPEHRLLPSPIETSRIHSPDAGIVGPSNGTCSFSDFVSEVALKVELETPLPSLLDFLYDGFRKFVPYQRMGYAEIDYEADRVFAIWHRSERPGRLNPGYSAALSESTLQFVARQNRPRILNLRDYLLRHPNSRSTRLLVEEGFSSSLTFPVTTNDTVVGFFFLTSVDPDGFDDLGVKRVREIVNQLSRAVLLAQEALRA